MTLWCSLAFAQEPPSEDEQWLQEARIEGEALPDDAEQTDETGSDFETFGAQLELFDIEVIWSGYGDLVFEWQPVDREVTFIASHFNPLLGASLAPTLWAEVEIEFEDAGTEVKLEYGILDFTPTDAFGLRMGQFLVPIGDFNENLHPSFRWPQVARPAMFRNVVPAVWSETGIQARGTVHSSLITLRYAAYIANGLGSDFDPDIPEPIRAMRDNAEDENYDLATGGELGLTLLPGQIGETSLSLSGYSGAIDGDASLQFSIADIALASQLGPVTLRSELAINFLGAKAAPLSPFGEGLYAQGAVRIGRLTPSIRYDLVREGLQDETPLLYSSATATAMVRLYTFWNVRAEVSLPLDSEIAPGFAAMSAFFF